MPKTQPNLMAILVLAMALSACSDDSVVISGQQDFGTTPDLGKPPVDTGNLPDLSNQLDSGTPDVFQSSCLTSPCPCGTDLDCVVYDSIDKCVSKHRCVGGQCTLDPQSAVVCDPHPIPCKAYVCRADWGICVEDLAPEGTLCQDGNPCTENDVCIAGICNAGGAKTCDDGKVCTTDYCDTNTGICVNDAAICNDGNPCTADSCDDTGACENEALVCDDSNLCTTDYCSASQGGCVFQPTDCSNPDPCLMGVCDPLTGDCSVETAPACIVTFNEVNSLVLINKCNPCHTPGQSAGGNVYRFVGDYDLLTTTSPSSNACSSVSPWYLGACLKERVLSTTHPMPPPWSELVYNWVGGLPEAVYYATYTLTAQELDLIIQWVDGGMLP